ncbi:MAG TPA: hypothetical protein VGK74_02370 [Symbiobacteriaceae bacterium]|jgi:hypothetical protein
MSEPWKSPPQAVLCQVLAECPDGLAATLLNCSWSAVTTMRSHHNLPSHWTNQTYQATHAAGRVLRERWRAGVEKPPEPIAMTDLNALVQEELGRPKARANPAPTRRKPSNPPNPLRVLAEAQRQIAAGLEPTDENIAQAGGWTERQVYNTLFRLRPTVLRNHDRGTYSLGRQRQKMDPAVVALMDTYRTRTILHNGPYREEEATR